MAGANYMGGKRNVTKARNDGPGRVQRMHFGRQRLSILAASLDRTNPSHLPQHPARDNRSRHLPSPISLAHARKQEDVVSFDSPHMASSRASSPSSLHSSRKCYSKMIRMPDISDPTCLRATLNQVLQLPDLISLNKCSSVSGTRPEIPRLCRQTKHDSELASPGSRSPTTFADSEIELFLSNTYKGGTYSTKNVYSGSLSLSKLSKARYITQSHPLTLAANEQSPDHSENSTYIPPSFHERNISRTLHPYSTEDPDTPHCSVFANTPTRLFRRAEMFISDFDDSTPAELTFTSPTPRPNILRPSILYNNILCSTNDLEGLMLMTRSTTLPDSAGTLAFDNYLSPVPLQPTILTNQPCEDDTLNIHNDILDAEDPWKTIGDILGLPYAQSSDWLAASSLELWPNQVSRSGVGCPQSNEQVQLSNINSVFHHPSDEPTLGGRRKSASSKLDFDLRDENNTAIAPHRDSQGFAICSSTHSGLTDAPNKRVFTECDDITIASSETANIQLTATPMDAAVSTTFHRPASNEMSPFTSIFSQAPLSVEEMVSETYDGSGFVIGHEPDDKATLPSTPEDIDTGPRGLSLPFPSSGTIANINYSEYLDVLEKDELIVGPDLFATVDMEEYSE